MVAVMGASLMAKTSEAAEEKVNSSMLVSSEWLAGHLHDSNLVVLCVAGGQAFYERHIPGARFIPLDKLVWQGETLNAIPKLDQLKKLFEGVGVDRNSRVILYG